ncbi:MAG TPA: D-2-hydroxyacid dehydrogenase, partial [Actinomycetota bacterium]|nr:D-2-hydroxyacid dehydrogenase [Actinomycetota bacterium]
MSEDEVATSSTAEPVRVVVVPGFLLEGHRGEIDAAIDGRAELVSGDDPVLEQILEGLEVIVTGIDEAVFERLLAGAGVRWIHSISAGVEHLPLTRMAERGILLTNSAGAYATAMAEYALGAALMLARGFPTWLEGQRDRRWLEDERELTLLRGKRLGIVGYGAVGREVAAGARALGMEVWATKRTPLFPSGEPLDRLLPATDLHELLATCDVVVLCASLNRTSRHLIGEAEFGAMRPATVLINVARGGLVDEEALVSALRDGRLAGAVLDVTDEEPLPGDSPLWTTPNLILTPHVSGHAAESWRS